MLKRVPIHAQSHGVHLSSMLANVTDAPDRTRDARRATHRAIDKYVSAPYRSGIARPSGVPRVSIRRLSIAALSAVLAFSAHANNSVQILHVQASDPGLRKHLGDIFGHIRYDETTGSAWVEADAFARDRMSRLGIGWQEDAEATAAFQAFVEQGVAGLRAIPGYSCYRTVEETMDTIDELTTSYPTLASQVDIGSSWRRVQNPDQGYPMRVLRLTNSEITGDKPILFAMSSVHAREYTPAELMTRFAEQLLEGYGTDADATWLLDNHEFHLLLHANPDGRKRAEAAVLWRKNTNMNHCAQLDGSPTGNSHPGVDLNRNFPFNWASSGTSANAQCGATYAGLSAASEPETQSIRDYVRSIFPDTRPGTNLSSPADPATRGLFLDMHSYSGLILWPWGVTGVSGNDLAFRHLGRRLAWFNNYTPQQSVALYPTYGTTVDFAYGELGVAALTYELGTAFFQSCADFQSTVLPDNLASLRYAARTLHAPYLLPAGPDSYDVTAESASVVQGDTVRISATVSDARYRNTGGTGGALPIQAVASAALYIDTLPWQDGATGLALQASDGSFNSNTETVHLDLDTSSIEPGRYLLYVQGTDTNGDAGPPSAVFLTVEANKDILFRHDFELPAR